mgnify:CR=1 FL=1
MREKQIEETIEFLNNRINVERNSYFGKGCIIIPIIEAEKILDILKGYRKQSEGEWVKHTDEYDCEYATCSCCGEDYYDSTEDTIDMFYNFCPNCGSKMKGDRDDN